MYAISLSMAKMVILVKNVEVSTKNVKISVFQATHYRKMMHSVSNNAFTKRKIIKIILVETGFIHL